LIVGALELLVVVVALLARLKPGLRFLAWLDDGRDAASPDFL